MVASYSVAALAAVRKAAAARMARKAYEKRVARKARADQASVTSEKPDTDSEADTGRGKCPSRPGSREEVTGPAAAMRVAVQEALACAEAHMAAFERTPERMMGSSRRPLRAEAIISILSGGSGGAGAIISVWLFGRYRAHQQRAGMVSDNGAMRR
jgi:hypothetical protein